MALSNPHVLRNGKWIDLSGMTEFQLRQMLYSLSEEEVKQADILEDVLQAILQHVG